MHRILMVSHAFGGGVEEHVLDICQLLQGRVEVDILRPTSNTVVTLQTATNPSPFIWRSDDWPALVHALASRHYQRIHFHHIHRFPVDILELPTALQLPYDVTVHDYMPYCPQYSVNTAQGGYCGEPDEAGCRQCLAQRPHAWGLDISAWRCLMEQFLSHADTVLAPTHYVQERIQLYFPNLHIEYRPHPPRADWLKTSPQKIKVVLLGGLSYIKGLRTLMACAEAVHTQKLPLHFCLLGYPAQPLDAELPIQIRGQYQDKELPALLDLERADVVWFPGVFPETHCYTLDVALASGVPIVASARGAFQERLQGIQNSLLIDPDASVVQWLQALQNAAGAAYLPKGHHHDNTAPIAARYAYAEALCAPLKNLPPALPVQMAVDLTTSLPQGDALSLSVLFEHGVLCQKTEARQALQKRLTETEHFIASTLAEQKKQIHQAKEQLGECQHDLQKAIDKITEFEQSTSWRITKPLRQVKSTIKIGQLKAIRLHSLSRQGWQKLPTALHILRTQGATALIQRVRDKIRGSSYTPPPVLQTTIAPIAPLSLPTFTLTAQAQARSASRPKVSIVIPVYGQHIYTFNCLKSLGEYTPPALLQDIEIIVVDDASPEPVREALPQIQGVRFVCNETNRGFIESCHHGASLAQGDYLVLLNNDVQVTNGWLAALLRVFSKRADAGLVGARLVYPDGRLQEAGGIVWRDGSAWNWGRFSDPEHPAYRYIRAVDYCSGACLALLRSDWEQWHGFDHAYIPAYYEDTDLAFRVRESGKKVYYQPETKIIHFEGISSGTDVTQGVKKHQVVNQRTFFKRWESTLAFHRLNGVQPEREVDRYARSHILVVEACMITPDQDAGSVRMQAMLEIMVELGHKVSFIADNLEYRQPYICELQQIGVQVWHHPYVDSVAQFLDTHGKLFDTIFFCRHYIAAPYMDKIRIWAPQAHIIFDTVDLHYLREQRKAQLEKSPTQMLAAEKIKRQELEVIQKSDTTLVVSTVEKDLLAHDAPGAKVALLSTIHPLRHSGIGYTARAGLLFVGGFRHDPNVDAVLWFVAQVWPRVRAQLPEVQLTIVGSHMPSSIGHLADKNNGIIVAGFVEHIDPLIDAARISIAPLRYGAGVKGKINQAMACGVPVVATSVAVEGMNLIADQEVLVADSPEKFADTIIRLYSDLALWETIAQGGYANVQKYFSRDAAKKSLADLLK